jgi:WD40 repeat protein
MVICFCSLLVSGVSSPCRAQAENWSKESFKVGDNDILFLKPIDDSKLLIGTDNDLLLFDRAKNSTEHLHTAKEKATFHSCAYCSGRHLLAVVQSDDSIAIIDVVAKKVVRELKEPAVEIYAVCFSADGEVLASAGHDNAIRIWDTKTYKSNVVGTHFRVSCLSLTDDGKYLASGGGSGRVNVWDLARKEVTYELEYPGWARSIAFAEDGALLAVGGNAGIVTIHDFRKKEIKAEFKHEKSITCMLFIPKSSLLACATGTWPEDDRSVDATLHFCEYRKKELLEKVAGKCFNIRSMSYENGKLFCGAEDGAVSIWSEKKKE